MISGVPLLLAILVSIVLIIYLCAYLKISPVVSLIIVSILLGVGVGMPMLRVIDAIQSGFGSIMKYIGLVVVFGSVIGVFLEKSGGALRIAQWILKMAGQKQSLRAMSVIGAFISIPVFCDSGFILLSGLSHRLSQLTSQSRKGLTLALATGLYTTHTLVPPTPGPIAAAGNLGAANYLGVVILMGISISIPVLIFSQFLARSFSVNEETIASQESSEERIDQLPKLSHALLPVILPIVLIGFGTLLPFLGLELAIISFIGNPLIAIFIGALMAMYLLRPTKRGEWKGYLESAIKVAGPILIITGAGGAFGGVLKATPLTETVGIWLGSGSSSEVFILMLVFLIAAILKTAQGSSTGAMVISSSLLAPLLPVLGWDQPIDLGLAIMAIGGGAMAVSHYNDSYFWVVSEFGKLRHEETYRSFTWMTGLMGLFILLITICLSILL